MRKHSLVFILLGSLLAAAMFSGCGDGHDGSSPTVIDAAGDIGASVDEYRDLVGAVNNGGEPGQKNSGRREINWDGVADDFAAPNFLPSDFFNGATAPRARGAVLTTPGDGVQVSADSDNPAGAAPRFGNINPAYATSFVAFSEERLFSPIGSNIVDLTFFIPGTTTPAVVNGFGAVYTGIDQTETAFEYFDQDGNSLGTFSVPPQSDGLSFLGVAFPSAVVRRVRIAYGNAPLGPDETGGIDVAVMDDFIYGEPQPLETR